MTKKSFKKLTSVVLAVLMLLSVMVVSASAADIEEAATGASTIYFDPGAADKDSPAWFAHSWTGSDYVDVAGVKDSSGYIRFDNMKSQVIFVRMPAGSTALDWDTKWNQSVEVSITDNLYTFADWNNGTFTVTTGHYDGGGDDPSNPTSSSSGGGQGSLSCYLDASFCTTGEENWYAWTWGAACTGEWAYPIDDESGYIKYDGLYENVVFSRVDAANDGPSWDTEHNILWNQTVDLDTEDGRLFVIDSWGEGEGEGYDKKLTGYWTDFEGPTDPTDPSEETDPPTEPIPTEPTAPSLTDPSSETSPTDPAAADEDTSFYVSAKSNINSVGSKVKVDGDTVTVTYKLTASEALDDGQITVSYDTSKLILNPEYNTYSSMFSVTTDANFNLSAGTGLIVFNFSGTNGKYDFTQGGDLVKLVFTKKTASTVGTATVYLKVFDLSSKNTTYVNDGQVKATDGLSITQTIESVKPEIPSETEVPTSDQNDIKVKAYSNLSTAVEEIQVNKSHVMVTYKLTAPEMISFGDATVTFDDSKLALESRYNNSQTMFSALNSNVTYKLNIAKGTMRFTFTSADPQTKEGTYDFRSGAVLISLVFTVKSGADGEADVKLNMAELGSIKTDYVNTGVVVGTGAVTTVEGTVVEEATTSATIETSPSIPTGASTETIATTSPSVPTTSPSTQTPTTQTPTTPEPTTQTPEPTTQTPTTPEPTTQAPTTVAPTTQAPTTVAPTTQAPTTPQPSTKAPSLTFTKKSIKAAGKVTLAVKNKGSNKVTFTSSNKRIATVTSKGVITGLQRGSVTITVKVGTKKLTAKLVVSNNPVAKIKSKSVSAKKTYTVKKGKKLAVKLYRKVSTINNKYTTSNKKIAKVVSKANATTVYIKGIKVGKATIKIKLNGVRMITVKVKVTKK